MSVISKQLFVGLFGEISGPDKPRVHNKHHRTAPADAVYVGRGSPWGNPWSINIDGSREFVIEKFRTEILPTLDVTPLRGKHLVCFCKPAACHGDLILQEANK
ncbi:hypothetical protein X766_16095 [Mesorhizobium sp. LSJC255A00]|uniref:DUF4326 domain-containing protein n=1 Tax=Mesorhizobium sp. LSJC255A00 TaxID=1287313 RepID=UPI0003CEB4E0|nr:DUF4326 domain-containing protein [Mesorhizobium sp. LSJC255A00]ESX17544.1 hypothetical protein X766_16095 [Mesorhizobium sp. LSJC255A00]